MREIISLYGYAFCPAIKYPYAGLHATSIYIGPFIYLSSACYYYRHAPEAMSAPWVMPAKVMR